MWNPENFAHFTALIDDLLQDEKVQEMQQMPQHGKSGNCYDHSLYVAYLSFLVCRRLGLDYVAAARGGMLHDFCLCNWKEESAGISRLWTHPHLALKNAEERYELSQMEKDIIVKHMWPLTRPLPRYRESLVVSMADKVCALLEMSRLYRLFKVRKNLSPATA
ncbi:MAG: HDIG domain-containing metalloprotein [Oscillospiraceae bacterium]